MATLASSLQPIAPTTTSRPAATFLPINPSATYLGPLATVFTPPASCFNTVTQWSSTEYVIFHGVFGDPACYPNDVRALDFNAYYYSPGVCPSGFTEACQDRRQWDRTLNSITASLCCPRSVPCNRPSRHLQLYSRVILVATHAAVSPILGK